MYNVKKIDHDLYWVGGNDRRLALFENIYPLQRGVSYNAYLLLDTLQFDLHILAQLQIQCGQRLV